jgi:hypothetical protein
MFASREGADELQGKENVAKMTAETPMHPTKLNFDSILLPKVPAKVQMLTTSRTREHCFLGRPRGLSMFGCDLSTRLISRYCVHGRCRDTAHNALYPSTPILGRCCTLLRAYLYNQLPPACPYTAVAAGGGRLRAADSRTPPV